MPHANLTRAEAGERAALVRGVTYDVDLDLTAQGATFPSRTVATFAAEPGATTFVDVQAERIARATLNGADLDLAGYDGARLTLPELAERNELVVEAEMAYQRSGAGLHRFVDPLDGATYLHTQFEPFDAHRVYACFDQPDVKATFQLTVRAPSDWTVVSNTTVERPPEDGRWRFAPTLPVPTYITAVVAGPLHAVRDVWRAADGSQEVPLGLYCRASMAEHLDADEFLAITKQGLDHFSELFAYPYPFGSYDQLLVPEFNWGAMENAGCVTFSEEFVFRSKVTEATRQGRAEVILHEMAHMWFGNLVTMRWWDDLWLNESFATYMAYHALAEATRFADAWAEFSSELKGWAITQDQLPSTHPISADIVDTAAVRTNFDGITYAKGAAVLRQLVAWVGHEAFVAGLRDYFSRHALGNAELADFLAALEGPSGRDLGDWSCQWLETPGVATLRPELEEAADGTLASVAVRQEPDAHHPAPRDHRLAVAAWADDDGALRRVDRVELDLRGERAEVGDLAGRPRPDLLLVNDGDLAYAKLRLDERSVGTLLDGLGRLDDALTRAVCWGAAWDMTRDAELPARRYVALVAAHAGAEPNLALLQDLTGRALTAAQRYGAPANRAAALAGLGAAAAAELARAAPGSDEQLVWARLRASAAVDDGELDWAAGVLDGDVEVPGLAVDTDLRWHLLTALAAAGRADEEAIAAEERRDPTDLGARKAAAARAARPDPAGKAAARAALLDDDELTLAMRRAIARGLWQHGQDDALRPLVDGYAEAVARVWRERDPEEAISLTWGLCPSTLVDPATVAAADAALADDGLPDAARRIVAEERDQTLRALRAREADAAAG